MKSNEKEFYTAEELSTILQVNIMTIYRYIKAGKLSANKIGKEFRVSRDDWQNFLNRTKSI